MNAARGGISAGRKTTANFLARKAFTVSMAAVEQVVACDYAGMESGSKAVGKLAKAGRYTTKLRFIDAPLMDGMGCGRGFLTAQVQGTPLAYWTWVLPLPVEQQYKEPYFCFPISRSVSS